MINRLAYVGLIITLAISATATASPILAGLLVSFIIIPPLSLLISYQAGKKLKTDFEAAHTGEKGKPLTVSLTVNNPTLIPIGMLEIEMICHNRLTDEKMKEIWHVHKSLTRSLTSKYCGLITLTSRRILLYDWFGVYAVRLPFTLSKRIAVMPDTFDMVVSDRETLSYKDDCVDYAPNRKGEDRTETFRVREYVPGDNIRSIHWKMSGKMQKLYVKDASYPVDRTIFIMADKARTNVMPSRADALAEACASMARALSDAGLAFTLVWQEEKLCYSDVSDPGELPEAIGLFMKAERPTEERSLWESFLGRYGRSADSRLFFFTDDPDAELPDGKNCHIFICGRIAETTDERITYFTPKTMAEVLRNID